MYPDNVPLYIDLLIAANPGMTEPELRDFLEGVGWVDSEVEKGVAAFAAKKVAAAAPRQNVTQQSAPTPVVPAQPVMSPVASGSTPAPVSQSQIPPAPLPPPVTGPSAVANPFIPTPTIVAAPLAQAPIQQSQQNQVTFGLKPVPAFEGMPHQAGARGVATQPVQPTQPAQAMSQQQLPQVSPGPRPAPALVEQPEIQPFNQAGFVSAPTPVDARFANGIRRVPSGMGAMGVTAPELTPTAQQANIASLNQEALSSPLYNTTPEEYAGYADAPKRKTHALLWVVILLLFASGAGTAAAQFLGYQIIPRSVLSTLGLVSNTIEPNEFLTRVFRGGFTIQSAEYSVRASIKAEKRRPEDKPFVPTTQASDQVVLKRDVGRFDDVAKIVNALRQVISSEGTYPYTLDSLKVPTKDSMGNPYIYRRGPNGETFELSVMFESADALDAAALYTRNVNGNVVTFTQKSSVFKNSFSTQSTPKSLLVSSGYSSLLGYVESDLDTGLGVSGTFDRRPQSTDAALSVNAHYYNTGSREETEVNFRKKGTMYFGQIATIPNLLTTFFPNNSKGIGAIEGKWFGDTREHILGQKIFSSFAKFMDSSSATTTKAKTSPANSGSTQIGDVLFELQNQNMIVYRTKPVQQSINSIPAYRYDLVLDYERMADFIERMKKDLDTRYGNESIMKNLRPSTIEYMRSTSFIEEARYFNDHTSLEVWVTQDDKPIKVEFRQSIVPDDSVTAWKNKQLVMSFVSEFKKVDEPVVVEAPKDYITIDEYSRLITGFTKTESAAATQMERVRRIDGTLRSYYMKNNYSYPKQLSDLTIASNILRYDSPLSEQELVDVYTQKPFVYRLLNNGASYEFDYMLTLPSSTTNNDFAFAVSQYVQITTPRVSNVRTLTAVNGLNTATPKTRSMQRSKIPVKDTDKDSFSDELEKYMGRNPLKPERATF
jgi:hypothetical protein